ncbi:MAG: MFS transporter [Bryobacterales bacterium]|nr:MFS transporter [Bryobacterales bacterium]
MAPSAGHNETPQSGKSLLAIPRGIWALGFVSMFMDISSEMILGLLPVFLVQVLGASATAVGVLEGVAESVVHLFKFLSGILSDWLGKRKTLALIGYGIAALTKPLFPLAGSFGVVFLARFVDRIGKGIRGAPRDALVADLAPVGMRGASYGLRQSLDTVGAFLGPLGAIVFMLALGGNFRSVFWIAVLPAFVSVVLLAIFVNEPHGSRVAQRRKPLHWRDLSGLPPAFWYVIAITSVFTLARFSEAFLVLRASSLGLRADFVPAVLVVMNVSYAASSYPAGRVSDTVDRRWVLLLGGAALAAADLFLAGAAGMAGLAAGICLWGLHMGLSQGLLAALVADVAPVHKRGSAFGLFSLLSGLMMLAASTAAGALWDRFGPAVVFYTGAGIAALGMAGLYLDMRIRPVLAKTR